MEDVRIAQAEHYVYFSRTERRSDYGDTTLAWVETEEEAIRWLAGNPEYDEELFPEVLVKVKAFRELQRRRR